MYILLTGDGFWIDVHLGRIAHRPSKWIEVEVAKFMSNSESLATWELVRLEPDLRVCRSRLEETGDAAPFISQIWCGLDSPSYDHRHRLPCVEAAPNRTPFESVPRLSGTVGNRFQLFEPS